MAVCLLSAAAGALAEKAYLNAAHPDVAVRPTDEPFCDPIRLKHPDLLKQNIEFINGTVKNKTAKALPDIDALYGDTVKVAGLTFHLPMEICETCSACYQIDFNADGTPDYLFVSETVWNGRLAGQSDVAIYVSNRKKEYNLQVLNCRHLEVITECGKKMFVKYSQSDDEHSLIRQLYSFDADGGIMLYKAERFAFR